MGFDLEMKATKLVPAIIGFEFNTLKKQLTEQTAKYDIVVTMETLPEAKALATELNKAANLAKAKKKEFIDTVSLPIKEFDEKMKELIQLYIDAREKLIKQIKRFEDEKKIEIREMLTSRLNEMWEQYAVHADYRKAGIEDLVLLGSITKKENLTAKVVDEINSRAAADKSTQDTIEIRLLTLENQSYRAGLSAPLTRAHVETFLFDDEQQYQQKLDAVMVAEIERQKTTEAKMQERLEADREQIRKEEEAKAQASLQQPAVETESSKSSFGRRPQVAPASALIEYAITREGVADPVMIQAADDESAVIQAVQAFPAGKTFVWLPKGLVAEINITRHGV